MKNKILIIISLFLICLMIFPVNKEFYKLKERPGEIKIPNHIKEYVIESTHSYDVYEITRHCAKITCDLLEFSFNQNISFNNGTLKGHCVTYARLHSTLCNIAFKAHNINAQAKPIVGNIIMYNININNLLVKIIPKKYEHYFINHDIVEITYDNNKILLIDPLEREFFGLEYIY